MNPKTSSQKIGVDTLIQIINIWCSPTSDATGVLTGAIYGANRV